MVCITRDISNSDKIALQISENTSECLFNNEVASLYHIQQNYCKKTCISYSKEEAEMLESEFSLRLLMLSDIWVKQLLGNEEAQERAIDCLEKLLEHARVGQGTLSKEMLHTDQDEKSKVLIGATHGADQDKVDAFWKKGAVRSTIYEPILKKYFSGYNKAFNEEYSKRPDILLSPYEVCSVLKANSGTINDINKVIARNCHAVEITAQLTATPESVSKYRKLGEKLVNYIDLVKEF